MATDKESLKELSEKARAWLDSEEGQATLEAGFRRMANLERPEDKTPDLLRHEKRLAHNNLLDRITDLENRLADLEGRTK